MVNRARYPLTAELRLLDVIRLCRGEVVLVVANWQDGPAGPPIALTLAENPKDAGGVTNYLHNGGGHGD